MDLEGFATLTNNCGTDFPNATLQLVAGEPNQVPDPPTQDPDGPRLDSTTVEVWASSAAPGFKEERLADYVLLTLDHPTSLRNGQTKQVKLFETHQVPVTRTFLFSWTPELQWFRAASTRNATPGPWIEGSEGIQPGINHPDYPADIPPMQTLQEAPTLLLEFQNDRSSNLGRPLPQGSIWLSTVTPDGVEIPLGSAYLEATPEGERALVAVPEEWLAAGLRATHRWRPVAWARKWMELEGESCLTNPRAEAVSTLLRLILPEGGEIRSATESHTMLQPGFFDFRIILPPNAEAKFRFRARIPRNVLPFTY